MCVNCWDAGTRAMHVFLTNCVINSVSYSMRKGIEMQLVREYFIAGRISRVPPISLAKLRS